MGYITSQRWSFFSAIMATHKSYYILNDNKYSCEASNFQSSLCFSESSTHLRLRCVSWHPLYFCRGARCWLWISPRWVHRTAATVKELICTSRLVATKSKYFKLTLIWKYLTAQWPLERPPARHFPKWGLYLDHILFTHLWHIYGWHSATAGELLCMWVHFI